MGQRHNILPLAALLLAGCLATPHRGLNEDPAQAKAQIERRLAEVFDAAATKDLARLESYHLYGPQFTKFAAESWERQAAEAARQAEREGVLASTGLAMRPDNLKIDVFNHVAITTFILAYQFQSPTGTVQRKAKATLVFVRDGGEWKIVHEHFSAPPPSR